MANIQSKNKGILGQNFINLHDKLNNNE